MICLYFHSFYLNNFLPPNDYPNRHFGVADTDYGYDDYDDGYDIDLLVYWYYLMNPSVGYWNNQSFR